MLLENGRRGWSVNGRYLSILLVNINVWIMSSSYLWWLCDELMSGGYYVTRWLEIVNVRMGVYVEI